MFISFEYNSMMDALFLFFNYEIIKNGIKFELKYDFTELYSIS